MVSDILRRTSSDYTSQVRRGTGTPRKYLMPTGPGWGLVNLVLETPNPNVLPLKSKESIKIARQSHSW